MEVEVNRIPVIGLLVLMLLVVSGYVASEETQAPRAESTVHVDPHVNYYQEHLARMGIAR